MLVFDHLYNNLSECEWDIGPIIKGIVKVPKVAVYPGLWKTSPA